MDNKTAGIIATVVATLLCGLPGLFLLCFGGLMALIGNVPGAQIDIFGSNDQSAALTTGILALCVGLIFIVIPFGVGFFTLRSRTSAQLASEPAPPPPPPPSDDEPLPPAI